MAHESLASYYKINFALLQHHKYSLTDLENMIPWEREVYVSLLQQYIEEENLKNGTNNGSKSNHLQVLLFLKSLGKLLLEVQQYLDKQ